MGFARMGSNPIGVGIATKESKLKNPQSQKANVETRSKADLNRHRWIQSPEC
jgi:hypothetical protein